MRRIRFVLLAPISFVTALICAFLAPGTFLPRIVSVATCTVFSFNSTLCVASLARVGDRVVAANPAALVALSLSPLEQQVIAEMNRARTNPAGYADWLESIKDTIQTIEGRGVIDDTVRFVRSTSPVPALSPSNGMSSAARELVNDLGSRGISAAVGNTAGSTDVTGSDGSSPWDRLDRYGSSQGNVALSISFGHDTAEGVVRQLIVDDGVPDRHHRQFMFEPDFRITGVACGSHARWRSMCSVYYAAAYTEREGSSNPTSPTPTASNSSNKRSH